MNGHDGVSCSVPNVSAWQHLLTPTLQSCVFGHAAGSNALTSDVGWGCTLRSGQMLLAEVPQQCALLYLLSTALFSIIGQVTQQAGALQGLLRHTLGRSWRRGGGDAAFGERAAADVAQLLLLMHDTPEPWAPFSLHNLCAAPGVSG